MSGEIEQEDDRIRIEPSAIRRIGLRQAVIRFAAGAVASLLAALVSQFAGAGVSGPLLALPAILIASLTLLGDEHGTAAAVDDARGAILGGVGLVAFAVIAASLLGRVQTWVALVVSTVGWIAVSLLCYSAQRVVRRMRPGGSK